MKQPVTLVSSRSPARGRTTSTPVTKTSKVSVTPASKTSKTSSTAATLHTTPSKEGSLYVGGACSVEAPTVESLLEGVKVLSSADRKQLLDALALMVLNESKKVKESRDFSLWVEAVFVWLKRALPLGVPPLILRQQLLQKAAWEPVEVFMRDSGFASMPVADRVTIYHTMAEILVAATRARAASRGFVLSPKAVADNCRNIAGLFEEAFPGYIAAGLVHIIIKRVRSLNAGENASEGSATPS